MKHLAFVLLFLVGASVMFFFDHWTTLLIGLALQVAAIVLGTFTVANPNFLHYDQDQK